MKDGKQARVLAAIRNGCATASDVEVELGFTLSKHQIAGHLSNLKKAGWIRQAGTVRTGNSGSPAFMYAVVDPPPVPRPRGRPRQIAYQSEVPSADS